MCTTGHLFYLKTAHPTGLGNLVSPLFESEVMCAGPALGTSRCKTKLCILARPREASQELTGLESF